MSDILDALRKAELQRSGSAIPGISTRQRYVAAAVRPGWPRLLLLGGGLLLGVVLSGVATLYLADNQAAPASAPLAAAQATERTPSAPRSAPAAAAAGQGARPSAAPRSQPAAPTQLADQRAPSEEEGGADTPPPAPQETPDKHPPATPSASEETAVASARRAMPAAPPPRSAPRPPAAHTARTAYNQVPSPGNALNQIRPPAAVEVQEFAPKTPTPPPAARRSGGNSNDAPLLTTLSYQYQTMVPKMSINAQVYGRQPADRFVVINMKRYAEGQQTAEGVTIEAIRQEDIVFTYQGQRFRLNR